jgi:hypothetical protein
MAIQLSNQYKIRCSIIFSLEQANNLIFIDHHYEMLSIFYKQGDALRSKVSYSQ